MFVAPHEVVSYNRETNELKERNEKTTTKSWYTREELKILVPFPMVPSSDSNSIPCMCLKLQRKSNSHRQKMTNLQRKLLSHLLFLDKVMDCFTGMWTEEIIWGNEFVLHSIEQQTKQKLIENKPQNMQQFTTAHEAGKMTATQSILQAGMCLKLVKDVSLPICWIHKHYKLEMNWKCIQKRAKNKNKHQNSCLLLMGQNPPFFIFFIF